MSRRILINKRLTSSDLIYNHILVNIIINRVLKEGKKQLAKRIVYNALTIINNSQMQNSLLILERAIRNISPRIQLKAKRLGGTYYQVPTLLNKFRSTNIAVKWLLESAKKRVGKTFTAKLAHEIIDGAKGTGNAIKKKEETHKMAEANKGYL